MEHIPTNVDSGTTVLPRDRLLGTIPKKSHNTIQKEYMHPCVYGSILYNS